MWLVFLFLFDPELGEVAIDVRPGDVACVNHAEAAVQSSLAVKLPHRLIHGIQHRLERSDRALIAAIHHRLGPDVHREADLIQGQRRILTPRQFFLKVVLIIFHDPLVDRLTAHVLHSDTKDLQPVGRDLRHRALRQMRHGKRLQLLGECDRDRRDKGLAVRLQHRHRSRDRSHGDGVGEILVHR